MVGVVGDSHRDASQDTLSVVKQTESSTESMGPTQNFAPADRKMRRFLNIDDLRAAARRRAHPMVFDYIDGGADDERCLKENSRAFDDYCIHHRVLVGVDCVRTDTEILETPLAVPFICSPAAGNRLFHTEGERAVAQAADKAGTVYTLSTLSSVSIEEIAALTEGPKWFQLYVWKDRGLVREMLERARDSGYLAIVLTVDFPITGNRERDPRNGFTIPPRYGPKQILGAALRPKWTLDYVTRPPVTYANLTDDTPAVSLNEFVASQLHAGFNWDDAAWILEVWNGPAVIKGVVRPDDAKRAVKLGFKAVSVSNHGGRQLDSSPAPVNVLRGVVDAVDGSADVILDGGVRRGTDVLKALALGAKAVSFARPYLYGLAAGGEAGATRSLQLFSEAIKRDMALAGTPSVSDIDADLVRPRQVRT